MLCIRTVPFQTAEILFGLVNMSIDYIILKLKKNHSLSQPHFYKRNIQLKRESEIKNELIDLRSKVSSSIFAGSRAWTYLGYIILVTLSVWPHDLRFSSVPVKCKISRLSLINMNERNKYGLLWNIRHSSSNRYQ